MNHSHQILTSYLLTITTRNLKLKSTFQSNFFTISRKYKIRDQDKLYFVTFTILEWIDLFTRKVYRDILLDSIRYCQKNKGLNLGAYGVMSSHVHFILGRSGDEPIVRVKKLIELIGFKALDAGKIESALLPEAFYHLRREISFTKREQTDFHFKLISV